MALPIITLLTDFGLRSHYAASMKGVILGLCPEARVVDVTHEVEPFAIAEAAYLLSQTWEYFPSGSIHVAVVDPGVGSARRPVVMQAAGHLFVGPDNGVFSMIEEGEVRHVTADRFFLHPVSRTFHGRDIFAPIAARLAAGLPASDFGEVIHDHIRLGLHRPTRLADGAWRGTILHVDRFGNLITNFLVHDFTPLRADVGGMTVPRRAATYTEAQPGELFLIPGSGGYWEISLNQARADDFTGARGGAAVELRVLASQNAGVSPA